jgi:hypothetical protein
MGVNESIKVDEPWAYPSGWVRPERHEHGKVECQLRLSQATHRRAYPGSRPRDSRSEPGILPRRARRVSAAPGQVFVAARGDAIRS